MASFGPMRAGAAESSSAPKTPNIIFILADDLGWADLGCYGSTFHETPNLDRLAASGMRFTSAYAACCVCSPTRVSILTGKYPARLGLTDWLPGRADRPDQKLNRPVLQTHLPLEEVILPEAFKEAGYRTAFIGKWHLGGRDFYPEHQGFDLNVGGCEKGSPPSYFSPYKIPTLTDGPKGEYLTDRLTQEAVKFIQAAGEKPFLLYLSHYAVHNPQQAKAELIEKYSGKGARLGKGAAPEFMVDSKRRVRQVQNQPVYAAMLQSLDESIGAILTTIREARLEDKTVVMFTSDNGGLSTAESTPTSNVPLRMGKGWPYEGGVREPLIVRWPGVTKPGSVCDAAMISTDYYPTLLEIGGLPSRPQQHLDGTSFVRLLRGEPMTERPLFWHYPHYSNQGGGPYGAVRVGNYKLIEWYEDGRSELFDLRKDLSETNNLAAQMPERVTALRGQLHEWRKAVHAAMPTPNPDYKGN